MRADPPWADIYLQFREADFGRVAMPGLTIIRAEDERPREFKSLSEALKYITNLHDQRLKGTK